MNTVSIRLFFVALLIGVNNAQLTSSFYDTSCPGLLANIKASVNSAITAESRMGASLLRLHFHDCFVNGCDASNLLDNGEKLAPTNANSARGFDVIDTIKSGVEGLCPGVVSCADILAVVARDSVSILGGPTWEVLLGRRDSLQPASVSQVNSDIPAPSSDLSALIASFAKKSLTASDMVALSGAHTIGQARCINFRNRIYNEANIDATFAATLQGICPSSGGDDNLTALDSSTTKFDNAYYTDLIGQKGVFHSDQQLFNNTAGSNDTQITDYSTNSASFFADFASAMIKMSSISPLTGSSGQIRKNCRQSN